MLSSASSRDVCVQWQNNEPIVSFSSVFASLFGTLLFQVQGELARAAHQPQAPNRAATSSSQDKASLGLPLFHQGWEECHLEKNHQWIEKYLEREPRRNSDACPSLSDKLCKIKGSDQIRSDHHFQTIFISCFIGHDGVYCSLTSTFPSWNQYP